MSYLCPLDNTSFFSLKELCDHIKKFRIKQSDFFLEYYPRKDLLTGEQIPFKTADKYLNSYFINKNNLKKYLKENPDAKSFSVKILKERIEQKQLKFAPGEVELSSIGFPSIKYYNDNFGYNKLCVDLNIQCRYDYNAKTFNYKTAKLNIISDTREQKSLKFSNSNVTEKKLEFGDYAIQGKENVLSIERKSLNDLISSFVTNYDRLYREFQRAKAAGAYLIVVCESDLNTCLNYNAIPFIKNYSKVPPEALFYNIRQFLQEFDCQFLFCENRKDAAETITKIFNSIDDVSKIDLQYFKNLKLL